LMNNEERYMSLLKDHEESKIRRLETIRRRNEFEANMQAIQTAMLIQNAQLLGVMYSAFNPNLYLPKKDDAKNNSPI